MLTWSHVVLNVRNLDLMLDFYQNILGFDITDRGPIAEGGPEIVFLSQQPSEHHQLAMVVAKAEEATTKSVNHLAFRVPTFQALKTQIQRLQDHRDTHFLPLSHGNTLSVYFGDPEGNGFEVFWDTPWHVAQPQGKPWDISLSETAALNWIESTFSGESSFEAAEDYHARRRSLREG